MVTKLSYNTALAFGEESTLGTAVAPTQFIEYSSESFNKEFSEMLIDSINGTQQYTKRVTMEETASGGFEFPIVPTTELLLFRHLSDCNYTSTTLTAGVYEHTFNFDVAQSITSFTFQLVKDSAVSESTYNITGGRLNSAGFGISVGGLLTMNPDIMAVNLTAANTLPTASYPSHDPYTFKGASISFGSVSAAATTVCLDAWSCNIAKNLMDDTCLGSATRAVIENGKTDVTGEISGRYQDETFVNYFLNQESFYLEANFDSGLTISGAYTHQITFKSGENYFNGSIPQVGGAAEILKQSLPYRAIRDDVSGATLQIVVVTSLTLPSLA